MEAEGAEYSWVVTEETFEWVTSQADPRKEERKFCWQCPFARGNKYVKVLRGKLVSRM